MDVDLCHVCLDTCMQHPQLPQYFDLYVCMCVCMYVAIYVCMCAYVYSR